MVDIITLCIGGVTTGLGLYFAQHYHRKYSNAAERTKEVRQIAEESKTLIFSEKMDKQAIIVDGVLPHYTVPNKIETGLKSVRHSGQWKENVSGEDFVMVHRVLNELTPLQCSLQKSKIKKSTLIDRILNGTGTDTQTFSRASQLAVMGVVGYDLVSKQFYMKAEIVGENIGDIIGYFEGKESGEIAKVVLCVIGAIVGGCLIYKGIRSRDK